MLKKELGLEKEALFLKKVEEQLKLALIKNSNLFLMPSIVHKNSVEGFGITFIEAASYGVGSIGGQDGGERDAIKDKETGLICDGRDINSIYENTIKFFENQNDKRYGLNALQFSKQFKWPDIVKKYLSLI